ncbi:MAG: hypothetical protein OXG33_02515 [Chloroflexi bacterium]|nr:hypothetical protein [Chloroflexota bacterium]
MLVKTLPLGMVRVFALKLTLILLITVSLLFTDSRHVRACTCEEPIPLPEILDYFPMVFAGRVIDERLLYSPYAGMSPFSFELPDAAETVYTFLVSKIWKGPLYETVYIQEWKAQSSCSDRSFELGEEYLIYAEPPNMTVSFCSASKPLASAQEDLGYLGAGQAPEAGRVAPRPFGLEYWHSKEELIATVRRLLARWGPEPFPTFPATRSTAMSTPTPVPGTPTPQPTPTPASTPETPAVAATPEPPPIPSPHPAGISQDASDPVWLIPTVAGVSGVIVGVLATTLLVRQRRGGT